MQGPMTTILSVAEFFFLFGPVVDGLFLADFVLSFLAEAFPVGLLVVVAALLVLVALFLIGGVRRPSPLLSSIMDSLSAFCSTSEDMVLGVTMLRKKESFKSRFR